MGLKLQQAVTYNIAADKHHGWENYVALSFPPRHIHISFHAFGVMTKECNDMVLHNIMKDLSAIYGVLPTVRCTIWRHDFVL